MDKVETVAIPIGTIQNRSTEQNITIEKFGNYSAILKIEDDESEESHYWINDAYDGHSSSVSIRSKKNIE